MSILSLTLTEYPKQEDILRIARHKEVHDTDRERLEAFAKACDGDKIQIKYEQRQIDGTGNGRLFPKHYRLSAIYQWGRIRSTLYGKNEVDIDIVSAQPSILLGYCKEYELNEEDYSSLSAWVANRDEIIKEFEISRHAIERYNLDNDDNKTAKDLVKNLVVITSFGSNKNKWVEKWGLEEDEYKIPRWYNEYEYQSRYIARAVVRKHPKRNIAIAQWKASDSKKSYEKKRPPVEDEEVNYKKVLAFLLQDKEAEIVVKAIKKLQKKGIEITSYIYDGFQVKNTEKLTDELLNEISVPEYNVKFIRKPFAEPLDLSEENLLPRQSEHFRAALFNAIGKVCDDVATPKAFLAEKKKYFEEFFNALEGSCRIVEYNSGKHFYHKISDLNFRFANCLYNVESNNGIKKAKFIDWWLQQEDRKSYRSIEMLPPPLHCPDNVKNLWTGWPIENQVPLNENADYSAILELFDIVTGREEESYEYLLNLYAHKVQLPGKKTLVMPIFYSEQEGTGKTTIAEDIWAAFLRDEKSRLMMSADSIEAITGKFSDAGEKLVAVINEVNLKDSYGRMNELKSFTTDTEFRKEVKGVQAEMITNVNFTSATSNNGDCIKIGQYNRRFPVFEADGSVANNKEVFNRIYKALNDESVMRNFFEFLKNRDIANFSPSHCIPKNRIYKEFVANSLSTLQLFYCAKADSLLGKKGKVWVSSRILYDEYSHYCIRNNRAANKLPQNKFTGRSKVELQGLSVVRKTINGEQKRGIEIDIEKLKAWVYDKRGEVNDDELLDDPSDDEVEE
jgi:hypothetical protein